MWHIITCSKFCVIIRTSLCSLLVHSVSHICVLFFRSPQLCNCGCLQLVPPTVPTCCHPLITLCVLKSLVALCQVWQATRKFWTQTLDSKSTKVELKRKKKRFIAGSSQTTRNLDFNKGNTLEEGHSHQKMTKQGKQTWIHVRLRKNTKICTWRGIGLQM